MYIIAVLANVVSSGGQFYCPLAIQNDKYSEWQSFGIIWYILKYTWPNLFLIFPFQACAQYCALVTGIMKMVSAVAFLVGKAWSASWDMTNVKWLIALDMANVLMGNVFVPEDTLDQHASKVSNRKKRKQLQTGSWEFEPNPSYAKVVASYHFFLSFFSAYLKIGTINMCYFFKNQMIRV